ncbi:ImmA/IrrE family metallo-endopeptidase [Halomonas beimenensis]|uniref:IrrE N-terminal-like domain-containing protein n=1 Tax=Halomonas beimenensis TaxID=475662 RepID=A0A291PCA3_9GAMM|nr:hypothetical protein [Halomonas beimenensis]ATJ84471.1 hypothetical protein BEI_3484 [Halomonas beimenensis]
MNQPIDISAHWCHADEANEGTNPTLAEWRLSINDQIATTLIELGTGKLRDHLLAPMDIFAEWIAINWWRLRWEPAITSSHDWKMSHFLPSIGNGIAWPNVSIASDGDFVHFRSRPTRSQGSGMPVKFVSHFDEWVPAEAFEQGIDKFMSKVTTHLLHSKYREDVAKLWDEIIEERNDTNLSTWRRLEALLGYDPDQAPDEIISSLINRFNELGKESINEVAAEGRSQSLSLLKKLEVEINNGTKGKLPPDDKSLKTAIEKIPKNQAVWRRASDAAALARKQWRLGNGPISDNQLLELLQLPRHVLGSNSHDSHLSVGLRTDENLRISLGGKRLEGRRFALARVLADNLISSPSDHLLPITRSGTSRQRFQRAFAQEFLCPFSSIKEEIGDEPSNEDFIEDISDKYGVSPMTVEHLLINRGIIQAA